jgi:hypothetical protein
MVIGVSTRAHRKDDPLRRVTRIERERTALQACTVGRPQGDRAVLDLQSDSEARALYELDPADVALLTTGEPEGATTLRHDDGAAFETLEVFGGVDGHVLPTIFFT